MPVFNAGRVLATELYAEFWVVLIPEYALIVFRKLLRLGFGLAIISLRDPRVDPLSLFTCRMTRGQEEISTSQVGRRRGSSRESPTMSSLVASMSMEELRSFCRVPDGISLEFSDRAAFSIVGRRIMPYTLPGSNSHLDFTSPLHRW